MDFGFISNRGICQWLKYPSNIFEDGCVLGGNCGNKA
jgi:hypothetical protein